jgi:transcriptional regulator with XRE-family HTH domain
MPSPAISDRIREIRLSRRAIAAATGLVPETIGRVLNGQTDPLRSTAQAIEQFVITEELRLRDHLLKIHPLEAAHDA